MKMRLIPRTARWWLGPVLILAGLLPGLQEGLHEVTSCERQAVLAEFGEDVGLPNGFDVAAAGEASRFLMRASFGPTIDSIVDVATNGPSDWIDRQVTKPPSLLVPPMLAAGCSDLWPGAGTTDCGLFYDQHLAIRHSEWWKHALHGDDQLRQRVAFALSEIFVASQHHALLGDLPVLLADYYDTLARGAFGSYRTLLEDVSLHPAMGVYLSMLQNRKEDPALQTRPDENYAREIMQLFSLGLVQLNPDGSPLLDASGQAIPTYSQDDVKELARVFTGWNWASADPPSASLSEFVDLDPWHGPMQAWPAFHDGGAKTVLGVTLPAGATPEADLAAALDLLANHPNVGPFLGRQLIQRLVTSNPSPAYVARISAVWADDGAGQRGNLEAVVRAILLDPEADGVGSPLPSGKIKEPLLMMSGLWRACGAQLLPLMGNEPFEEMGEDVLGQRALHARSVFNFFRPTYTTPALGANGLVAPEKQILSHATLLGLLNLMTFSIQEVNDVDVDPTEATQPVLDLALLRPLAAAPDALITVLDVLLCGGRMDPVARLSLLVRLAQIPHSHPGDGPDGHQRVLETLLLITHSPAFLVQP